MKKVVLLFTILLVGSVTTKAKTTHLDSNNSNQIAMRGYGNSFIFVEDGIEFSIFPDGQFDFYLPNYGPNVNVGYRSANVSISFNSGYDYSPYVQYDDYGAIIQIENVPIYYDYYGRIVQAGNVNIHYNNFGRVSRVGGLYVHYRNRVFSHYTGFINVYNRHYVYRPWHRYYVVPSINLCIVSPRPYRQYYSVVRHPYYRPYVNNHRPYTYSHKSYRNNYRTSSATKGRRYATTSRSTRQSRISDRYAQSPTSRRNAVASRASQSRSTSNSRGVIKNSNVRRNSAATRGSNNRVQERRGTQVQSRASRTPDRTIQSSTIRKRTEVAHRNRSTNARAGNIAENKHNIVRKNNVTKARKPVSNRIESRNNTSVRKPNRSAARTYKTNTRKTASVSQGRERQQSNARVVSRRSAQKEMRTRRN